MLAEMNARHLRHEFVFCGERNGEYFGMNLPLKEGLSWMDKDEIDVSLLNEDQLRAFFYELSVAVSRMKEVLPEYGRRLFPVRLRKQDNMDVGSGGFLVSIDNTRPRRLAESLQGGTYQAVSTELQSEYFHELLHGVRIDLADDGVIGHDDLSEAIPELGEFLYDPAKNVERNKVYRVLGSNVVACETMKKFKNLEDLAYQDRHDQGWLPISRLLIGERQKLKPSFVVPQDLEGQYNLLVNLPDAFRDIPQAQRDGILRKYIKADMRDIEQASLAYGKELGLKF